MEKVCRVLYKHGDIKDWIAFDVYQCKKSLLENHYQAYWMSPLNEVLFYESDNRLDTLQKKLGDCVEPLGYQFFWQEHLN
jgi:hypothetical protein